MGLKFKQIFLISLTIFLISIITVGCLENVKKIKKNSTKNKIKIGFCMDTLVIERWQRDRDIFVAKAKQLGAEVIVKNANEDSERQIKQIEDLIEQKVDVLVIIPYDKDGLAQVVKTAKKRGIKVISYDRLIRDADVDMYISFDNVKVGQLMGEYLIKKVPTGNYIIINGSTFDNNSYMFNKGYKKVLEKAIREGKINIINETWADGWREDVAYDSVEKAIKQGYKINAVIGANDRLAEGAIQALSEYRLADKVQVVGHDADLSACQRIVEGTQLMTVYKPIKELAQGVAEIAVKLAKGEKVEVKNTIYDNTHNVPYKMYEPIAVTKDNIVDTVVKDGFHSLEDIYRNVPKDKWPVKKERD